MICFSPSLIYATNAAESGHHSVPRWNRGWTLEQAEAIIKLAEERKVALNDELKFAVEWTENCDLSDDEDW